MLEWEAVGGSEAAPGWGDGPTSGEASWMPAIAASSPTVIEALSAQAPTPHEWPAYESPGRPQLFAPPKTRRLLAYVLDAVLALVFGLGTAAWLAIPLGLDVRDTMWRYLFAGLGASPKQLLAIAAGSALGLVALIAAEAWGGSIGKRILGMKTVRYLTGEHLGVPLAVKRLIVRTLFLSPGLLAGGNAVLGLVLLVLPIADCWTIFRSREHRMLHDMITRTMVIDAA